MKKFFAIFLSCVVLLSLGAACSGKETEETTAATEQMTIVPVETEGQAVQTENFINYKGLHTCDYTELDMQGAEGRAPDFSFDSNGVTVFAYNNVSLNDLEFTQVQYSFGDTNRISCTVSTEEPEAVMSDYLAAMTALYGNAAEGGGIYTWRDSTANYVMLTQLNDTTVQLAFYFSETAQ